jgi:isocitrate/isopropylmalate dehydrogenase
MLEALGLVEEASAIDRAILASVEAGEGTPDIGGKLGTRETGDAIAAHIKKPGSGIRGPGSGVRDPGSDN